MIPQFTAKNRQTHEREQPISADFYAGCGIQGLGLRVWGLWFGVQGSGLGV
jgi:hypothetical protein